MSGRDDMDGTHATNGMNGTNMDPNPEQGITPQAARPPVLPAPRLETVFKVAYGLGLLACVGWPLVMQFLLGRALPGGTQAFQGALQQLGYTFTGLSMGSALFVWLRSRKAPARIAALPPAERGGAMGREILLYAALLEAAAVFGLVLHLTAGADPQVERYARTFLALPALMFLTLVPRLSAWKGARS